MYQAQLQISEQDIRTVQPSTQPSGAAFTPSIKFGQQGGAYDSKSYVYALCNASTAANPGQLQIAPAAIANHLAKTQTAAQAAIATAGSTTVLDTVGATAVTQNQYMQGYLTVVAGTGAGIHYRIKSNTLAASSGTTTISLVDPIVVGFDSTTVISLYLNPWNGFAISSTTLASDNVVGIPNVAVPVGNYAWLQVDGYCSTLANGTIPKGDLLLPSVTTAGAVDAYTASGITQSIGYAPEAMASTQYQNAFLAIQ